MRNTAAARRYARALFSIAEDAGTVDSVRSQLDRLGELLDAESALKDALFRPLHPVAERRSVLEAVARRIELDGTVRNFLSYLVDQRRLVHFDAIRSGYQTLADQAAGLVKAEVVAAGPLEHAQRERLQRALAARTGRKVQLDVKVDPDLIGGAVAVVGNLVFDGSLRTQLDQLRDTLSRG